MKYIHHVRGFSLVEVALALGIIAFAVVGIMGLLATAINSGKASTDDTLITDMATGLINDLRHQYFMAAKQSRPGGNYNGHVANSFGVLAGTDDVAAGAQPASATSYVFFDVGGARLQTGTPPVDLGSAANVPNGAIYQCKVISLADAATLSATSTDATPVTTTQATNLLRVTLVFTWPAGAPASANSKTIHATLARY